jgi:RNA recognition motif-containing protein
LGLFNSDRPLFVGNLPPDATVRELESVFEKYGTVKRVDLKTGFAFVYLDGDANEAVRNEDNHAFYNTDRRMRVEVARGDGDVKRFEIFITFGFIQMCILCNVFVFISTRREEKRKRASLTNPTDTLFVVNYDPSTTSKSTLQDLFDKHGEVLEVSLPGCGVFHCFFFIIIFITDVNLSCYSSGFLQKKKKNLLFQVEMKQRFAFIKFATVDAAKSALEALHGYSLADRLLTVEYKSSPRLVEIIFPSPLVLARLLIS